MSTPFNPDAGLIVVSARLVGPTGDMHVRLALDTGATVTLVRTNALVSIGIDPALSPLRARVTTGSGIEYAPRVMVEHIEALGQARNDFDVVALTIPQSAGVDGVLGLDFMRGHRLVVDFRKGRLTLT